MNFYQLALRYLHTKKGKTVLLLFVLILVNSMILNTSMILRATNQSKQSLQEKTNSKIVAEITDEKDKITAEDVEQIKTLEDVAAVNRSGRQEVYPVNFAPVTASAASDWENQKIAFLSYDDLEKDSPFSEMQYRLSSGSSVKNGKNGVVINRSLASENNLEIGDTMEFCTKDNTTVSAQIIGIFKSAQNAEKDQPEATTAVNRIENQVFVDNNTYMALTKAPVFDKVSIYVKNPENLEALRKDIKAILGAGVELRTSDTLYQQMSAPLEQIRKIATLMLLLTLSAGTLVVTLLLCMWMRSRQKEMAIFMSVGKKKSEIFLQTLLEGGVVFLCSVLAAAALGKLLSGLLQSIVSAADTEGANLEVLLQLQDIGSLLLLGGAVILIALSCSVIPVLGTNPKDILAKMEG